MARFLVRPARRRAAVALVTAAVAIVAAAPRPMSSAVAATAVRRTQADLPIAAGARVRVHTVAGDVDATASASRTVAIRTHFGGRDGAAYGLHVDRDADGLTVCATRTDEPDATCDGGSTHERHDASYTDAIDVTVPAGVAFEAVSVSGGVKTRGVRTLRTITTVSGAIDVDARAAARLATVNGKVRARLSAAPGADLAIETVVGAIDLALPRGDYTLKAQTLSGSIASTPPLLITSDGIVNHRASATLGRGTTRITLESVAGAIGVRFL